MERIPLAIVGIDRHTDSILSCLLKSDRLKLCALCETRPPLLNKAREQYPDVRFYDDPREMTLREKPKILLLWRDCCGNEFPESVIEQGCWLVLRPPIPGGLAAAVRRIKLAEKHNVGLFVWTPWLFLPCYESLQDWLAGQQIRSFACRVLSTWTDLELPAQDTLLASGMYSALFLTHRWLGLPGQVYCRQLFKPAQSADNPIQYFGLANLIYPQSLGVITLGINAGPAEDQIVVTSNAGQVRAEPTGSHFFDCAGNLVASSHVYDAAEARHIAYTRHFEAIWQSLIGQQRSTDFELKRHLGVLAILEAAALSARTGHPEQLAKIVEFNNVATLAG